MGGVARRATAIEEARKRQPALLLLDAGNALVGDMEPAISSKGATSIEALNRLGYSAVAIGARDLALGLDALRQRLREAQFPLLSANLFIRQSGALLAEPYVILESAGRRIGVIGLTGVPRQAQSAELEVRDPLETLRRILPEATSRSDFVIVLAEADHTVKRKIVAELSEVDLVVSAGDQWTNPPEVGAAGGLIVQPHLSTAGHAGLRLGILRLALDGAQRRQDYRWESLPLGPEVPDEPAMAAWVDTQTR